MFNWLKNLFSNKKVEESEILLSQEELDFYITNYWQFHKYIKNRHYYFSCPVPFSGVEYFNNVSDFYRLID